MFKKNLLINKT